MIAPPAVPAHVQFLSPVTSIDFPDEWYDLNDPGHFWFAWRLRALGQLIRAVKIEQNKLLKALDVGCGTGILRDQIEAITSWHVDGFDLNLNALAYTRPGRGGTFYYNVLDQRADLLNTYDVAFLFDVIEHIDDTNAFLKAVIRHLRPGGWLIINVPALQILHSVYDDAAGHYRRYNRRTLRAEVEPLGFIVGDIRYWGFSMVPLLLLRKLFLSVADSTDKAAIIRKGFKPPGRLAHAAFRALMRMETALMGRPPLGTSVLMAAQKPAQVP